MAGANFSGVFGFDTYQNLDKAEISPKILIKLIKFIQVSTREEVLGCLGFNEPLIKDFPIVLVTYITMP